MNEMIKNTLNEACGEDFDLFEKAFNESAARHNFHHKFSGRHKRRMDAVFKNCDNPALARKKYEAKPFWSEFGIKQAAAAAAGFVLTSGLIFGGVKAVDMFSEIAEINADANKRYDELLKDGNYYLTSDNSIYFKVGNGSITLCGDKEKIIELFMNDETLVNAHWEDPDSVKNWALDMTEYHMSGINYAIVEAGEGYKLDENGNKIPYERPKYGFVDLANIPDDEPWSSFHFIFTRWNIMFDGEDTIRLLPLGDFVLGE